MTLTKTEKRLIWVLVVVAIGVLLYFVFFNGSSSSNTAASSATTTPVGADILALVEQLQTVSIDPSIFSTPAFASLNDAETPLSPEVQGRADPFSPLGVDAPFTTTVTAPVQSALQSIQGVIQTSLQSSTAASTAATTPATTPATSTTATSTNGM